MLNNNKFRGFTLIELAITLTIISFIIGTTFTVRQIRANAILNEIMAEITQLNTSFISFESIYKNLPGDMYYDVGVGVNNIFGSTYNGITILFGDGSGIIENQTDGSGVYESVIALQHLSLAGLIKGFYNGTWTISTTSYNYMPSRANKVNDGYYFGSTTNTPGATFTVFDDNSNSDENTLIVYARIYDSNNSGVYDWYGEVTRSVLNPYDAFKIDQKYDDGYPTTGLFLGANGSDVTNGCVNTGTTPYSYVASSADGCYVANVIDKNTAY